MYRRHPEDDAAPLPLNRLQDGAGGEAGDYHHGGSLQQGAEQNLAQPEQIEEGHGVYDDIVPAPAHAGGDYVRGSQQGGVAVHHPLLPPQHPGGVDDSRRVAVVYGDVGGGGGAFLKHGFVGGAVRLQDMLQQGSVPEGHSGELAFGYQYGGVAVAQQGDDLRRLQPRAEQDAGAAGLDNPQVVHHPLGVVGHQDGGMPSLFHPQPDEGVSHPVGCFVHLPVAYLLVGKDQGGLLRHLGGGYLNDLF